MNQIWLAFITGLTTGGISCLAVQGGLLTSAITGSNSESDARPQKTLLVGSFLVAKLIVYTALGFLLGLVGSKLIISPVIQGWMQILVGLFMIITAARLLNLHPIFRNFVIQPPVFLMRLARNQSKVSSVFTPALLGFLTVLIPCGVTQAMMVLALGTANPVLSAGIMFAFVLGTSPVFFALGVATLELLKRKSFTFAAAGLIAILGINSINSGQNLRGSVHTLQNYWQVATSSNIGIKGAMANINIDGKQEAVIQVNNGGYNSKTSTLKVGIPVKLILSSNNVQSCTRAFTIPSLNITKVLPENGIEVVEFTPTKTGRLSYACSMGMYTGQFTVVN